jgi:hemolysin activation/secretion protein
MIFLTNGSIVTALGATASMAVLLGLMPMPSVAQALPDAGSLLRENRRDPTPVVPAKAAAIAAPTAGAAPGAAQDGPTFTVSRFRIEGATLLSEALLQAGLAPWLNRPIHFADLEQAAQSLADAYRSQGWLARPQLPAQDLVAGVVTIRIIEARLGEVRIDEGDSPLRFDRERILRALSARSRPGQALRPDELERAVNLLNDSPGLHAEAVLAAGRSSGETDLILKARDLPRWSGNLQFDNQNGRATGAARLGVDLALASPGGIGDQILFSGHTTGADNDYLSLTYIRPLGDDGWRVGGSVSALRYRLVEEFAALGANGQAQTLGFFARYPILRGSLRNASLTLSADRRDFVNRTRAEQVSDKRLTSVSAALGGDINDDRGDGGVTLWGVNLAGGRVDLSANQASAAADAAGPRSAGSYARLGWNLGRVQPLGPGNALWISGSGQFANHNLDSAEKFSLGGANGVRAYPSLEASGDSGWLTSAEWRWTWQPSLQATVFYDHGQVRPNHDPRFVGAPALDRIALKGVGAGLNWTPVGRYTLRALLARRIGSNPLANVTTGKDSDGSLQRWRLWLALSSSF